MDRRLDLVIVGAGPNGLACGIEAKKRGLDFVILDRGTVVDSLYHYPTNMTFFTTAELLEIGGVPMIVTGEKPKRADGLAYYRRVVQEYQLPVHDFEHVKSVAGQDGDFLVVSEARFRGEQRYRCRKVILAIGYYCHPNVCGIPGEDLHKVSHYYTDSHPYFQKKVLIVGGRNSAALAALDLYRNGSEVILVHRGEAMSEDVKYWVLPDINNRIKSGEIKAYFRSRLLEVCLNEVLISTPEGEKVLPNDYVLLMTGYHPDQAFLASVGIKTGEDLIPFHNPETLESNVKGIYLAGAVLSGQKTNNIFIENGRFHGRQIFEHWDRLQTA